MRAASLDGRAAGSAPGIGPGTMCAVTSYGAGVHPDIPAFFVHFVGRPRADSDPPPQWAATTPEGRLAGIGHAGGMYARRVFGTYRPVLCFSECSMAALTTLFTTGVTSRGPWQPWAVVFDRQRLIDAGARPVLLLNDQEWEQTSALPWPLVDRRQRYNPPRVDFTAEREWRLTFTDEAGPFPLWLISGTAFAIITGQRGWLPARWETPMPGSAATHTRYAGAFHGLRRWWWNGAQLVDDGVCDIQEQATYRWQ